MIPRARSTTPNILQMEAVECGAAALAMILGYYRRYIPLTQLRRECGVSRDGSKASNVIKAARLHGLNAKGYSKSLDQVKELSFPCIVFWEFNHFLVVEGVHGDKVFLNDPAVGHRVLTFEEFDHGFTGVVLQFEPGDEFETVGKAPSALPGLWQRVQGNLPGLGYMVLLGLLLVIPGLAMPAMTKIFLDEVISMGRTNWFRPLIVAMVVSLLLQMVLTGGQLYLLRRINLSLSARLTTQFFSHLLRLPLSFYTQRYAGDIVNRTSLNEKVSGVLTGQLSTTLVQLFTMVIYGAILMFYSVSLTLIGVTSGVLNLFILWRVSKSRIEANMRMAKEQGMVGATAIAGISSMETIKSSSLEDSFFARWSGYFANATNSTQKLACSTQLTQMPVTFTNTLTGVLILVIGSFSVIRGEMSIGMLVAFQSLMQSFLAPITAIMSLGTAIQEMRGDVLRLDDVLQNPCPPEVDTAKTVPQSDAVSQRVRTSGRLQLRGITFGYSPLEKPIIEEFDLEITPGQRVALVGGSGSGKSTIARIVCGLYDAWDGEILLDQDRIDTLPPAIRHNSLAIVEQEVLLFEGTVRENLTLWDDTVPRQRIEDACRDAAIWEDVLKLPGGLKAPLKEGGNNLSGGQRQRLEIARALVNSPSLLVMDEATSALDTETEMIIDQNIRRRGCACLIIAHRLSTIRDCDEIIVMERGKAVERGTHDQLWEQGGKYAELIAQADEEGH
ncbi:MAG TPA: NHLP family bacteriocin export ABC transporter peptidase/permease/ATPase subunit [Planctomycetaceae bacterium]|nr:NHLP family bacteriocin export ABC transporter peptidase/permease/ATPase subunit [Planctomycetaceae bacterium]